MYILSVQYSCAVVSVFLFGGKANLVHLTLFYSTLLALTHRQKDIIQYFTLASRGLEEPAHALRGLEELFFQLCCCVSFWFWWEIGFGLHTYVLRVPYSCGVVSVFVLLAGNSFWYVRTYHTVVVLCQFFWFWQEIVFWCYIRTQCTIQLCGCVLKK